MTARPVRRTLLLAAVTGAALATLSGTVSPAATADRPVVQGPFAEDGTFIGPVTRGQSALHSPRATEPLGRKFK